MTKERMEHQSGQRNQAQNNRGAPLKDRLNKNSNPEQLNTTEKESIGSPKSKNQR